MGESCSSPCESQSFSLFWGSGSVPCWRVMICLEEKALRKYDSRQLSFLNGEHKSEHVLDINPRGQLPAFKHDDTILNESLGICHYLEDMFPNKGSKLLPDNQKEKALTLQRVYETLTLQRKWQQVLYYLLYTPIDDQNKEVMKKNKTELIEELRHWENYLEKHEGDFYLTGKEFTMADAVFFPQLAMLVRMHHSLGKSFPLLNDYYNRLSSRDSIQITWPPHWKEVDGQDILGEGFDANDFDVTRFFG
ncbi:glutathione S-transferase A-like [Xenia sp. Carnegie-2017]|uniref:glutathione S-transferase A-like n=1 Tax=Xenia sp. Carnegie-2017 TaxID=2897299 RepID=UPI001F04B231|nr:glutathione S-transferase A-like [Xenia sp. Carnegie-2017]